MNDPALLELFTCLREAGLPLGLAEYHLLLQAVHGGFGIRDRTALAQLCCALWVKSEREKQIFQDYFDQLIPEQIFVKPELDNTDSTTNQQEQPISRKRETVKIRRFVLIGLTTCVVAIGSAFFLTQLNSRKSIGAGSLAFDGIPLITPHYIAKETDKTAKIKIIRTGGSQGAVSGTLTLSESNRLNTTPQKFLFPNGKTEKIIEIPIVNNNKAEIDRPITLSLTNIQGGAKLGAHKVAVLTIQDDDGGIWAFFANIFPNLATIINNIAKYSEELWIIAVCIILLVIVWNMWKIRQTTSSRDEAIVPQTYTNLPRTMLSPEVIRTMADEIQVAKTIRRSDDQLSEFPLIVNDLLVTHRQMKQGWRYLRQFSREGPPIELDMEATIQQVAQHGVLLNPVLVPRRTNRIELLLLIDRDGSMVPFHHLSQELADTALRGGRFSQVRVYYFHNCPDEYLYRDRYHLEAESIDDCLSNLPKTRTVCLIFSDAGAARGGFSSRRRRLTKFFLKELGQYVRYITWLNPVPRDRWETTTAHEIAALVPMFEVNRQEFYRAVDVLRGRHQPSKDGE
ncbi:VWA containing CoxE family protein [Calothrix sp. NIES-2100]|uniref:hypothetical protein n=1 Tax=Calothrix sp. NIES-2100 TaxID=1954172 RepID=UPI000B60D949|nr:VWA containing CoxE family protein [Calothrix sp. NIES-2100]